MNSLSNKFVAWFRDYALLLAASVLLVIESGFRAAHWLNHFSHLNFYVAVIVSIAYSVAIGLACIGLLLLTSKEFAEGSTTSARLGFLISASIRGYILWENVSISEGDQHTQVFLQVMSIIVAVAEIRIAMSAYAAFRKEIKEAEAQKKQAESKQRKEDVSEVAEIRKQRKSGSNAKTDGSKNLPAEASGPEALERFENEYEMQHGRKPTRAEAAAHFLVTDRTIRTWARA